MENDSRYIFDLEDMVDPQHLAKVENALAWLKSSNAGGIGEQLLDDMYKQHGKPLRIFISPYAPTSCYFDDKNLILINPYMFEIPVIPDGHGGLLTPSPETMLAHELVHAGQPKELHDLADAKNEAEYHLSQEKEARIAKGQALHDQIAEAPDFQTALARAEEWVDQCAMPAEEEYNAKIKAHPAYVDYMQRVEGPAVEVENRVAVLQGRPERQSYEFEHMLPSRESLIEEALKKANAMDKPGAPSEMTSWQDQVSGDGPKKKSHPRVSAERGRARGEES